MTYAIYSTATGAILRIVSCPSAHALQQLSAGEALLPDTVGTIRDDTHKVEGGAFVELPPPPPPPAPTAEQVRARFIAAAQAHLDTVARGWGYDDIRSACSYIGDPYPRFAAEALALRDWRSAVWAWLDASGGAALPDPLPTREEFIALLPAAPARPTVA